MRLGAASSRSPGPDLSPSPSPGEKVRSEMEVRKKRGRRGCHQSATRAR